jgi:glycosyltransferase involved in cell wall biosynthesis
MKILHIITRLIQGGAQQNTVLSCAAQVRAGHGVHLAYGPIYGPEGSLLDEAKASGAVLHEIPSMRRAVNLWHDRRCYYALRKLIREVRPDVVHTHSSKAGIVGRAAAWHEFRCGTYRIPPVNHDWGGPLPIIIVHTVHGLPFHKRQNRLIHYAYVMLERRAAKRCHHLVAITPAMVEAFERKRIAGADRFTVIPSGVDLARFEVGEDARVLARQRLEIGPNVPVVALLARLDALKGHDDVLDILPGLLKRFEGLQLLFIGDGWRRGHLEARIRDEGLAGHVRLMGLIPHERVREVLPAADVKVLPSYQEGQSRTLVEALLCGCGIVAYDVGGIGSVCVDGETGRLVPVGDKGGLAEALSWMLDHPEERRMMTERGRALVREKFGAESMTRELERLYQRLLSGSNSDGLDVDE